MRTILTVMNCSCVPFEYRKEAYTTNNSYDNRSDIDGDGRSWNMGGGILAKMEFFRQERAMSGISRKPISLMSMAGTPGPGHFLALGIAYFCVYGRYTWTRVQGYVGQKQGISGSCNVMYEF